MNNCQLLLIYSVDEINRSVVIIIFYFFSVSTVSNVIAFLLVPGTGSRRFIITVVMFYPNSLLFKSF